MRNKNLIIIFLLSIFFSSCVKDIIIDKKDTDNPISKKIISSTIQGSILNETGKPFSDALVYLNNTTEGIISTRTDENGFYTFFNKKIKGDIAKISVSERNHFNSYHSIAVISKKIMREDIVLVEKTNPENFTAQTGGNINFENRLNISFPKNSIEDEDGNEYLGTVSVYSSTIDPNGLEEKKKSTGGNIGIDEVGEEVGLYSFSTINVELIGSSGQKLKIKKGYKVTIKYPVPSKYINVMDSPSLMYFNERDMIWEYAGKVEIKDGFFISEVEHFSEYSWCELLKNLIKLEGKVSLMENGVSYDVQAYVQLDYGMITFEAKTSTDGYYSLPYSLGKRAFDFKILDNCRQELYQENYSQGFVEDHDFGTIELEAKQNTIHTLKATVLNCDSTLVKNGYSRLCFEGLTSNYCQILPIINGDINFNFVYCDQDLIGKLKLINYDLSLTNQPFEVNLNTKDVNLGDIFLCDVFSDYFRLVVNGNQVINTNKITTGCQREMNEPWFPAYQGRTKSRICSFLLGDYPLEIGGTYQINQFRTSFDTLYKYSSSLHWDGLVGEFKVLDYIPSSKISNDPDACKRPALLKVEFKGRVTRSDIKTDVVIDTVSYYGEFQFKD